MSSTYLILQPLKIMLCAVLLRHNFVHMLSQHTNRRTKARTFLHFIKTANYPCLCLCFGFSQITLTDPFLLITLHFSQIGFTDALTFTLILLSKNVRIQLYHHVSYFSRVFLFISPNNSSFG